MDNVLIRAKVLAEMDEYMCNLGDEDKMETWLAYGVPDETEDYGWLADDIDIYTDIVYTFASINGNKLALDIILDIGKECG